MFDNFKNSSLEKEIGFFLFFTFSFSSLFYYLVATNEDNGWYFFGLMWCPGIASILNSLLFRRTLKGFGWSIGKFGYLPLSYLLPIIELSFLYGIIWHFDLGVFAGFENNFITRLAPIPMLLIILEGSYFSLRSALGEEIGWRGYMVPRLLEKYTPNQVSLFSGLIWSSWHFPIMITGDYGVTTSIYYQLICFTLMIMGTNFIYTWFRIKSGSLWTGVLLHTSGNLFIFHIFDELTIDNGNTPYFMGETGAVYALYGLLLIASFLYFGWDWPTKLKNKVFHTDKL